MSPVSTLPSLSTTRCVTRSSFLNTTCWPPNDAGLGVKACVPFWPTMVIVGELLGDGAVVGEPLLPHPKAAAKPVNNTAPIHTRRCIASSFHQLYVPLIRCESCKTNTSDVRRPSRELPSPVLTIAVSALRQPDPPPVR